ncbi:electron transport complex subunit RsxC [Stutzerimonas tarimensis]|uniref:Ion-translocating oxidoreductase complex subunit C n=1 Tax=Stutzerimonas tarimensis TaxID=1507735 RepID=A0ABV7T0M7_9GAMM
MSAEKIWDIHGGIHPAERKELSNGTPIEHPPLPARLTLPLSQHIGSPARPCVAVGDRVLKGQKIADATSVISAPLHAPTSGTVSFIGPQPFPHPSGMLAPAIVIDSDGRDEWIELTPRPDYREMEPEELVALIREGGLNGLGGAGFPTAVKLATQSRHHIDTLIINGTECEPYITADDRLMRERAAAVVSGIEVFVHLLTPERIYIGLEDNKPEAAQALRDAIGDRPYSVRVFPTKYPSGGEKQLIQILTGVEVPSGKLPADVGVLCQNVGTCAAVHDAVVLGKPLISRITTLTGEALERPMNVEALFGTPVSELLAYAGLRPERIDRLIMGGPMMGFTLPALEVPLIKTANCLLAPTAEELPAPPPAMPCIRCGACEDVCPARLLPQQLHFFALGKDFEQIKAHNLFDCIECGACAYVCPSTIPLVQYYRVAKAEIREMEQKAVKADYSKQRFEQRQERLRRAEELKEAERKARAERAARAKAAQADVSPAAAASEAKVTQDDGLKRLKIEASMAQVALKKAEKQLAAHETPELEAQVAELRNAAAAAQQALEAAAPAAAPSVKPAVEDSAKKAKIEAAMLRAQIRKLEKAEAPDATELEALRTQLATLEAGAAASQAPTSAVDSEAAKKAKIEAAMLRAQIRKAEKIDNPDPEQVAELTQWRAQLSALEQARPATPDAPAKPALSDALKAAKIELATRRAELKKAEKAGAEEAELAPLREALAMAEQALHAAEAESGKPVPERVRVEKQPVDERRRALKTEVAFARADLRKLERDETASEAQLDEARRRLAEAERQLQAYQTDNAG